MRIILRALFKKIVPVLLWAPKPVVLKDPDGDLVFLPQLISGGIAAFLDAGLQLAIMAVDDGAEFSWMDVGVSFAAGATGVGLGNLAAKTENRDRFSFWDDCSP